MQASENVSLAVAFLKSYEHMGMFDAACEKGCTCERIERDGHSQEQVSQMHLAHLLVSVSGKLASPRCPPRLRVRSARTRAPLERLPLFGP